MNTEHPTREKSYQFALRMIKMFQHLNAEKRESVLSKQGLRSGTSIGANVREALAAQSKKDFIAKMFITYNLQRSERDRILADAPSRQRSTSARNQQQASSQSVGSSSNLLQPSLSRHAKI